MAHLPDQYDNDLVPHDGHRAFAACFATLPATILLTVTLWTLAGACATSLQATLATLLIFAGLYPFSFSVQHGRGTWIEPRMKLGRLGVLAGGFVTFVLFGPGPTFFGIACTSGPTVVQSGALIVAMGWTIWWALRVIDPR